MTMIDIQEKFSEQISQFSQYQKDAVASLQAKSVAGADSFEKFARYNVAVLNDVVDFTVEQARLATSTTEPREYISKQIDSASAFARVVEGRTKEYVDLLTNAAEEVTDAQDAAREVVVEAVKKSA
jgi:flagellar hook-basal body complex protein FliE